MTAKENEDVPLEKIAQAAQHAEALKRAQAQAETMREARSKAIGGALPRPKLAGLGCAAFFILALFLRRVVVLIGDRDRPRASMGMVIA